MSGKRLLSAGLFGLLWLLPACAPVAPWERGTLAKPHMALEPNPAQRSLRVHAYRSRESAAGWGKPRPAPVVGATESIDVAAVHAAVSAG